MPQRPILSGSFQGARGMQTGAFDRARSMPVGSVDRSAEAAAKAQQEVGKIIGNFGKDLFQFAISKEKSDRILEENEINGNAGIIEAQIKAQFDTVAKQAEEEAKRTGQGIDLTEAYNGIVDNYGNQLPDNPIKQKAFQRYLEKVSLIHRENALQRQVSLDAVAGTTTLNRDTQVALEGLSNAQTADELLAAGESARLLAMSRYSSPEHKKSITAAVRTAAGDFIKFSLKAVDTGFRSLVEDTAKFKPKLSEEEFGKLVDDYYLPQYQAVVDMIQGDGEKPGVGYLLSDERGTTQLLEQIKNDYGSFTAKEKRELYQDYFDVRNGEVRRISNDVKNSIASVIEAPEKLDSLQDAMFGLEALNLLADELTPEDREYYSTMQIAAKVNKEMVKLYSKAPIMNNLPAQEDFVMGSNEVKALQEEYRTLSKKIVRSEEERTRMNGLRAAFEFYENFQKKSPAEKAKELARLRNEDEAKTVAATNERDYLSSGKISVTDEVAVPLVQSLSNPAFKADPNAAFTAIGEMVGELDSFHKNTSDNIPRNSFIKGGYAQIINQLGDAWTPEQRLFMEIAIPHVESGDRRAFNHLHQAVFGDSSSFVKADHLAAVAAVSTAGIDSYKIVNEYLRDLNQYGGGQQFNRLAEATTKLAINLAQQETGAQLRSVEMGYSVHLTDVRENSKNDKFEIDDYIEKAVNMMFPDKVFFRTADNTPMVITKPRGTSFNEEQVTAAVDFMQKNKTDEQLLNELDFTRDQLPTNLDLSAANWIATDDGSALMLVVDGAEGTPEPVPMVPVYKTRVLEVIDGDTADISIEGSGEVRIRMGHMNAPESDEPGGTQAKNRLEGLTSGQELLFRAEGRTDPYGRALGVLITPSGENINAIMIREGNAISFMTNDQKYVDAHNQAHEEGLYADRFVPTKGTEQGPPIVEATVNNGQFSTPMRLVVPIEKVLTKYGSESNRRDFFKRKKEQDRAVRLQEYRAKMEEQRISAEELQKRSDAYDKLARTEFIHKYEPRDITLEKLQYLKEQKETWVERMEAKYGLPIEAMMQEKFLGLGKTSAVKAKRELQMIEEALKVFE